MRYLLIFSIIICTACSQPSIYNDAGRFDFGQNPSGKNFPEYLYTHVDTVTHEAFHPGTNDVVIWLTRDENLSARYLGKSVIRVTYTSAFSYENFLSVSLVSENGETYLIEKEAYNADILDSTNTDGFLHFLEFDSVNNYFKNVGYAVDGNMELKYQNEVQIDPLLYSRRKALANSIWEENVALLESSVFKMSPWEPVPGLDGHDITIETHFPDGYYAVKRWVPKDKNFRTLAYAILSLGERAPHIWQLKMLLEEEKSRK